jgi:transaldolase
MKYFLDSAALEEIIYADKHWGIDGVTTNPRHIKNSGKPFFTVIREIGAVFIGRNFPISVEINPHLAAAAEMVAQAKSIATLSPNFVLKLPCTEQGLAAARELEREGIKTNVTLVFSPSQAIQAARLGAAYVSPFLGWKEASGERAMDYLKDIGRLFRERGYKTEIIAAAVRSGAQIAEAALAGAQIVTAGFSVYKESFWHPFTDHGLKLFQAAWDETEAGQ